MTEPGDATPQELGDSSRPDIADRVLAVNAHLVVSVVGPNEALVKHGSRSGFSMLLTDDDRSGLLAELLVSFREPTCLSALISNGVVAHGQVEAAEAFVSELLEADVLVDATVSSLDAYTELQFGPGASTRLVDSRVLVVGDGFVAGELLSDLTTLELKSLEVIDIAGYTQPGPSDPPGSSPLAALLASSVDSRQIHSREAGSPWDSSRMRPLFEHADFVAVALDTPSTATLHSINEAAIETTTPWISAYIDGSSAFIGPLFVPRSTACFAEFAAQVTASMVHRHDYEAYLRAVNRERASLIRRQPPPGFAKLIAGWTTAFLTRFLASDDCPLAEACLVLDLERMAVDRFNVLRLPRCPVCRTSARRHVFQ